MVKMDRNRDIFSVYTLLRPDCNYFAVRKNYYYVYMLEIVIYDYSAAFDIILWKSSLKNMVKVLPYKCFCLYIMIIKHYNGFVFIIALQKCNTILLWTEWQNCYTFLSQFSNVITTKPCYIFIVLQHTN